MIIENIKDISNDLKHKGGLVKILTIITATVLAIFFFKIPVWKPKKRKVNYSQRRSRYWSRRKRTYKRRRRR